MGDDVIEGPPLPLFGWEIHNALAAKFDIAKTQGVDQRAALIGLPGGQINPKEPAVGKRLGHWNKVTGAGAAQFQNPAAGRGRAGQAIQRTNHCHAIGMSDRIRETVIGNRIVSLPDAIIVVHAFH